MPHGNLIDALAKVNPDFHRNQSKLHAYRALRNAIVHQPVGHETHDITPIAEPRADIVCDYLDIVSRVLEPPAALDDIAIAAPAIFTVAWNTPVGTTLTTMKRNAFRLAPIVSDYKLVGLFDLQTLVAAAEHALNHGGKFELSVETTFENFRSSVGFWRMILGT